VTTSSSSGEITRCLRAHARGDEDAGEQLAGLIYDELHRIAHLQRRRGGPEATLQTTGLVHETYIKLVDRTQTSWNDRVHFFAVAARAMRQILIDQARRKLRAKRGGGQVHLELEDERLIAEGALGSLQQAEELLSIHAALERLEAVKPRLARVVEFRFFAGLSEEEAAQTLGVSTRTVERDWVRARAWLREAMRS
jgi:RNA polymerase sigma factor (TIGR02999 family)